MAGIYNRTKKQVFDALAAATLKVLLVNTSYVFNPDHNFVSQVAANEVSGTGYAGGFAGAGRKTISTPTANQDDTNDRGYLDGGDLTWTAINVGDVGGLVIYKNGTSDADSVLVAFVDTGFPVTTNGADLSIPWSNAPAGIIQAT